MLQGGAADLWLVKCLVQKLWSSGSHQLMMETQTSCITRWISRLLGPSVGVAVLIHVKKLLLSEDLSLAKITFSEYLLPTESAPVTTAGDLCLYTQIVKVILSKYRMKVSSFLFFFYKSFLISH